MRSKSSTSRLDEIEFHFHNARRTTCLAVISVTLSCAPPHAPLGVVSLSRYPCITRIPIEPKPAKSGRDDLHRVRGSTRLENMVELVGLELSARIEKT